jgi:sugar phosphate isomerase/epimerase
MTPCISQACTLPADCADDLAAYAGAGWPAVELWLTKVEAYLQSHSAEQLQALFADGRLKPIAAAYQGGLLIAQGDARQSHFEHFRQRLNLCQTLGVPTLLVAADFLAPPDSTTLSRAVVSLKQAGQWAAAFDVRLALEFRGPAPFCSSLDTAIALVDTVAEPNVGLCLDLFHYYRGPSKFEDLARLTPANLFHVQICDVAGVPRELAADGDRVLPDEGDFQLRPILEQLRRIGYTGAVSLELFNPTLWQVKPSQLAELALASLQRLLPAETPLDGEPTAG